MRGKAASDGVLRAGCTDMLFLLIPLWLHKALPLPFLPIGFCILFGILGLLLKKRWITGFAIGVLWVFSLPPTATWLMSGLENGYPAMEVKDCPKADAIVVLCGMLNESVTSATEWKYSVDRFERAVELAAAGRAPVLLFTRGLLWPENGNEIEGVTLAREAVKHGIPAERIVLTDETVIETSGEMRSIRRAMEKHGWRRIILVTSAFHMPRSMWLARKEKIDAIPFPADFEAGRLRLFEPSSLMLKAECLEKSERAIREWIGMAYYRVFGI